MPSKPFPTPQVQLTSFPTPSRTTMDTHLVCDASGFSRRLTSKSGKRELLNGWNCDAYWAYFTSKGDDKAESRLDRWDYPATKHMCKLVLPLATMHFLAVLKRVADWIQASPKAGSCATTTSSRPTSTWPRTAPPTRSARSPTSSAGTRGSTGSCATPTRCCQTTTASAEPTSRARA
jgi:hypothetical protein